MIADLVQRAQSAPADRIAAIDDQGESITYGALLDRAVALGAAIGSERQLILLEGQNSVAWLVAYLAALIGRHPVLIAPGGNPVALGQLEAAFAPSLRMTAASAFLPERASGGAAPALHPDLALMLSTSGSTGSAKCVRLSHANLAANANSIAEYLGIGGDERGVVSLPTHYSYGLSVVNSHLWAGATLLLTASSVIDAAYWDFCAAHGATSFAGVPHSYDLLSRIDFVAKAPPSLRYFTQAGGRLPERQARHFAEVASANGWRFVTMYGQTEATARMAYLPPDKALEKAGSIGIAIPGGRLSLIDADGAPVEAANEAGELVYEGANVMMGYATGPDELADPPGPSRLATGDLACRDEDGFFYITGRLSRFVKIFGNRIGLDDVERLLAAAGHGAVATGIDDQLLVVTRDAAVMEPIRALLRERLKLPEGYFTVRAVDEYPLLASGKVDYAGLKASLAVPAAAEPRADGAAVAAAFAAAFGAAAEDENQSFVSLGGDSLNYVMVALGLERILGPLPDDWINQSIGALATLAERQSDQPLPTSRRATLQNLDTLRGLACLLVVAYHVVGPNPTAGLHLPANSSWQWAVDSLKFFRMPLFTAMAGFLYAAMPVKNEGPAHFIARKARLLLPPLLFVTMVTWVARGTAYGRPDDLVDALLTGYLHLWFLYALMVIFIIVALLDTYVSTSWKFWIAVLIAAPAIRAGLPFIGLFAISNALYLLPFFALGMVLHRKPGLLYLTPLLVIAAIAAVAAIVGQQAVLDRDDLASWQTLLAYPGGTAIALLMIRFVPRLRWIEPISAFSFTIYLWHPVANGAVRALLIGMHIHGIAVLFVAGMIAGVMLPVALHCVMMRMPRWIALPVIGR